MKKLIVEMDDDLKIKINVFTAQNGITIKDFILNLIENELKKSEVK
jgi:hypothetical protein